MPKFSATHPVQCTFSLTWISSFEFPARLFSRLLSRKPGAVQLNLANPRQMTHAVARTVTNPIRRPLALRGAQCFRRPFLENLLKNTANKFANRVAPDSGLALKSADFDLPCIPVMVSSFPVQGMVGFETNGLAMTNSSGKLFAEFLKHDHDSLAFCDSKQ